MNSRAILVLLLGFAIACPLSGCLQVRYGWKQERELLADWGTNFLKGQMNEIDPIYPSYEIGIRADFHDWNPVDDATRGVLSDIHRITTP